MNMANKDVSDDILMVMGQFRTPIQKSQKNKKQQIKNWIVEEKKTNVLELEEKGDSPLFSLGVSWTRRIFLV